MATAEQVKALIKAHYSSSDGLFESVAMQIAAFEARKGKKEYAREIRNIIETEKKKKRSYSFDNVDGLIDFSQPSVRLNNLVLDSKIDSKIKVIVNEFWNQEKLEAFGLKNKRKILLAGPPGTGKTMTASVLANELGLPLGIIQMDKMMTKYMGETTVKLRQIFDSINSFPAVYLFDEFDAIGSDRNSDNDVGEVRRILNTFLQLIEQNDSNGLIIAATNNFSSLDSALFRRFDEVIQYGTLSSDRIEKLIKVNLRNFQLDPTTLRRAADSALGLSQAEIVKTVENTLRYSILYNDSKISEDYLLKNISEVKEIYDI
ncbi:AAA family ATPase [Enterococcus durans]|uniref:AAA family ATPase n=1 Tax=Enterococcus durans TaxID=53345 RepID=UPI0039A4645D